RVRVILIEHRIIEDEVAACGLHHLRAHIVPDETRRNTLATQVTVDGVVAQALRVVGEVRQRVVDLADEQVLAVVKARDFVAHGRDSTAFSRNWRPLWVSLRKSYLSSPWIVSLKSPPFTVIVRYIFRPFE